MTEILFIVKYWYRASSESAGHLVFPTLEEAQADLAAAGQRFVCEIIKRTTTTIEEAVER